ncbi:hypothetical protein B0J12DRAFT_736758 [Macrophomina phaseolina]|uniref:Methyltransferase domain-containing protein n=1 Tax=Macrophomina phaseolina TaxID=35725 RepID=A0ABQ8GP71_9PEZI|nr:hypothetical protein B0J12DRAFT_736758 [Macrophomina phaseolina]
MSEAQNQEQGPQVGTHSKDAPWYSKPLVNLTPPARELLENYSGIPAEDVEAHVMEVRDKAWEIFPYPCIGMFRFLDLNMSRQPYYPEILERVKKGEKLLDLGCCFGQELRKLVHDGAPPSSLYGSDLRAEFLNLGHTLFRDSDTLPLFPHFIAADALSPPDQASPLTPLTNTFSIIHASSFFHLFSRPDQLRAAARCVALLRPAPGSTVVGAQVGSPQAREKDARFVHSVESWRELWQEVGAMTRSRWEVRDASVEQLGADGVSEELKRHRGEEWMYWLRFRVVRVA